MITPHGAVLCAATVKSHVSLDQSYDCAHPDPERDLTSMQRAIMTAEKRVRHLSEHALESLPPLTGPLPPDNMMPSDSAAYQCPRSDDNSALTDLHARVCSS